VNWPVAVNPERQVCKTTARGTRQAVDSDQVQCEINISFIFIEIFIDFVFLIYVIKFIVYISKFNYFIYINYFFNFLYHFSIYLFILIYKNVFLLFFINI
jgi:hypothetical protein